MTEQDLLDRGYHEFDPNIEEGCIKGFQRKFNDDRGIKYFITCYEYAPLYHPTTGENILENPFEFVVYFNMATTDKPIKMKLYCGWEVNEVEDYCRKLFETGDYRYYEEFTQ